MQKDLKTGMIFGLVLIASAALWLSTRQSLSVKSRMLEQQFADSQMQKVVDTSEIPHKMAASVYTQTPTPRQNSKIEQDTAAEQPRFIMDLPHTHLNPPQYSIKTNIQIQQPKTIVTIDKSSQNDEKIKPPKFHVVRRGETLSGISYKYYGSAGKWQKIHQANSKILEDANKLIPGTRLIIPH